MEHNKVENLHTSQKDRFTFPFKERATVLHILVEQPQYCSPCLVYLMMSIECVFKHFI